MRISLVVAVAENGVIGADNALPWRLKGDMAHFREITRGKPLVMGRKTWESFPKRPLPGRPNLIVTRNADYDAPGGEVLTSIDLALDRARVLAADLGVDEVCVLGGGQIYTAVLPHADTLNLTRVHMDADGDTKFPAIDPADWKEVSRVELEAGPKDSAACSILQLDRIAPPPGSA